MMLNALGILSIVFVAWFTLHNYRHGADVEARRAALVEAWMSIVIGFSLNFIANLFLIPLMSKGGTISATANFMGGWVYTAISLVRQYAIRRWCDKHLAAAKRWILKKWSTL